MDRREKEIYLKIYEENKDRMYKLLVKQCYWLTPDEICDIMQEAWAALGMNISKVADWSKAAQWKWLSSVAYNQAVNVVRGRVKRDELEEKIKVFDWFRGKRLSTEEAVIGRVTALGILEKLSVKDKNVLYKELLEPGNPEEKKPRDNAEICKIYRARKKLEEQMKEGGLDD